MNSRVVNAVDKREDDRHFFSIRRKGESCKQMRISAFGVFVFFPFSSHFSFRSRRCGDDFAAALSKGLQGMRSLKKLE